MTECKWERVQAGFPSSLSPPAALWCCSSWKSFFYWHCDADTNLNSTQMHPWNTARGWFLFRPSSLPDFMSLAKSLLEESKQHAPYLVWSAIHQTAVDTDGPGGGHSHHKVTLRTSSLDGHYTPMLDLIRDFNGAAKKDKEKHLTNWLSNTTHNPRTPLLVTENQTLMLDLRKCATDSCSLSKNKPLKSWNFQILLSITVPSVLSRCTKL